MKSKKAKIIVPIVIVLVLAATVIVGLIALRAPNKRIYYEYAAKMETVSAEYLDKLSQAKDSGVVGLAFIQGEGVNKLAFLTAEGITKMAKRSIIVDFFTDSFIGSWIDIDGYEKWAGKLDDKYMEEAAKINDKYMEIAEKKLNF